MILSRALVLTLLALLLSLGVTPAQAAPEPVERRAPGVSGCASDGPYEVCFSSPASRGGRDVAVFDKVKDLFASAGEGDEIRVAMFRWDLQDQTDALLAAQQRGAYVQLVADGDVRTKPAGARLIDQLEARDPLRRNVTVCQGACLPWRGKGPAPDSQDINHLKLFLFDVGGVQSFVTSSLNLEGRQASQYNSLLRVTDPGLYAFGLRYFQKLRAQKEWKDGAKVYRGGPPAQVYPHRGDLLLKTLRQTTCTRGARTVDVMIAVVQRYDVREQLGRLHRSGCKLRIVVTRDLIENWLQAPFRMRNGALVDLPNDRVRTIITHDKVYAFHARLRGKVRRYVVTGTSNTTCGGLLYNDEVMLRLDGRWAYEQYRAHVRDAFSRARQSRVSLVPTQARCR